MSRAESLRVHDLDVRRGRSTVLREVSFELPAGQLLAVVGPNGSGKSTLLRAITGITAPSGGSIHIGQTSLSARTLSSRRRAHLISLVSQEETPAAELTVAEAVALGRTPHRKPWASHDPGEHAAVAEAMDTVGLTELAATGCGALSGGQRHRVVLARALAQQAPVMLLDEPTNHLDPVWRLRLLDALRRSGRTVVFTVHELDAAVQYADQVAVLHGGTVAAYGPPAEVLTDALVREVFEVASALVQRPVAATHPTPPQHLLLWSDRRGESE